MQLYRLKSLDGDGLLYVLDMIVNERIYLSTCDQMNDVDEGIWTFSTPNSRDRNRVGTELRALVCRQRFTCFLSDVINPLMWAHYAGGFSGVAVEFDIDDSLQDIRPIDYIGLPSITIKDAESILDKSAKPQDKGLLKQKNSCWCYEGESRLYGEVDQIYVTNVKPISIIFGARKSKCNDVLKKIALDRKIKVGYMVPVSGSEFEVEYE